MFFRGALRRQRRLKNLFLAKSDDRWRLAHDVNVFMVFPSFFINSHTAVMMTLATIQKLAAAVAAVLLILVDLDPLQHLVAIHRHLLSQLQLVLIQIFRQHLRQSLLETLFPSKTA